MPEFNQTLEAIAILRARCRAHDDALHATRVQLAQTQRELVRAQQGQRVYARPERMPSRDDIARAESALAALRARLKVLDDWFAQLVAAQSLSDDLRQRRAATERRIDALRTQLAQLEWHGGSDAATVLSRELEQAQSAARSLLHDAHTSQAAFERLQAQRAAQERDREALRRELAERREALQQQRQAATQAQQPGTVNPAELLARQQALRGEAERLGAQGRECAGRLSDAIGSLYIESHPRRAVARLDDTIPFLLLPLRLETIFADGQSGPELWVRVYPDEIAIHTHEPMLTAAEVAAGELYWTELVVASHLRSQADPLREAAWQTLVEQLTGNRGAWVAHQTRPTNWDALSTDGAVRHVLTFLRALDVTLFDRLRAAADALTAKALADVLAHDDPDAFIALARAQHWLEEIHQTTRTQIVFPAHDLTKTDAWSRAPRTHVLPDRLVLLLYPSLNAPPREIPGALIPDTLPLGPDPLDAKQAFKKTAHAVEFGADFEWMSQFDKAVEKGMGFRVPLSAEEARDGFARVAVLGVTASATPQASGTLLRELLANHQYGPKGLSLVRQGTPTNNTDLDGTGYSSNDAYAHRKYFSAIDPPAFDPAASEATRSQTDGRRLADALGVDYGALQTVRHADALDGLQAQAMNRALFPATLGYWLRSWMKPLVTADAARLTREFFTRYVTGRGPLPAVRVGNQPYGVLLTSDLSAWTYQTPDNDALKLLLSFDEQTPFLRRLQQLLRELAGQWSKLAVDLPYIGRPGSDSADVLMNVLGLHPTSVEFFQRLGYGAEYLKALPSFMKRQSNTNELQSLLLSAPPTARLYLQALGITTDTATLRKMPSLNVLWQHYVTALDVPNLVDVKPVSETATLSVNYIDFIAKAAGSAALVDEQFPATPPATLLYLMLRNAVLLQLHHGVYEWLQDRADFDPPLKQALSPQALRDINPATTSVSPFELMSVAVERVDSAAVFPTLSVGDFLWQQPRGPSEASFLEAQKSALSVLAAAPTAVLERAFIEHLDCLQYRLDAWETGLIAQRLDEQRAVAGEQRATGVYLGAYGWLENLAPSRKQPIRRETLPEALRPQDDGPVWEEDDVAPRADTVVGSRRGGFIHAPSINHAAAGALLRNAYLSHAEPTKAAMFAVNLSSERVRRAQFLLEGLRNGQPIEALLGYQFERRLHDRSSESAAKNEVPLLELNQFILPYRQVFPYQAREIAQAGTGSAAEAIPAYNVVNGLTLSTASLTAANGYGLAAILPATERPNANQSAAILAEVDHLNDSLDAVKDLLMAENAYQLVLGNFERAGAVSLAQKDGRIPPELQVLNTPRGARFTFTQRVTLHFDDLDATQGGSNPWPAIAMTPRALAEPGMNHWLGRTIGLHPGKVLCQVARVVPDSDGETADTKTISLADLGLQPVDVVWLAGATYQQTGGATELESRIACTYRKAQNLSAASQVRIVFKPAPLPAGALSLAQLFPLLRHLHTLLGQSRALRGSDFLPAAGSKATAVPVDADNPEGYDVAELQGRVTNAMATFTSLADALDGPTAPSLSITLHHDRASPADDEAFSGRLGDAFNKLEAAHADVSDAAAVTVNLALSDADLVQRTLQSIAAFGGIL